MKAFRNVAGQVVEIEIDIDLAGNPILPPDTTTDRAPSIPEGHYATVVGDRWVVIAKPVHTVSFEMKKQSKLDQLATYRKWILDQPIEHDGRTFDADELARARVSQALVSHQALGELPTGWIDHSNELYAVPTIEVLNALALAIASVFQQRFFDTATIRSALMATSTEAELEAIEVPSIPMNDMYMM
ncbi:hypothetical protein AGENTSMITH_126 [Bacillus phage vB_BspM_AgentSmith]|nr:hypothetical protein AGENTSMITH_126 [Bacillus phage vB_BspM_AgentSmith]